MSKAHRDSADRTEKGTREMPETQVQGKWWVAEHGEPVEYCVALGATLRRLRESAGRTQVEVSRDVLDTKRGQLARYESGEAKPPLRVITDLCDVYEANPIELLTRVAMAVHPGAEEFGPLKSPLEPLPGVVRFWVVMLLHDGAKPGRGAIDRKREKRREQQMAEDTTSL